MPAQRGSTIRRAEIENLVCNRPPVPMAFSSETGSSRHKWVR
jgi:hypothetical protein